MGLCRYCGKPVGFFRYAHAECEQKHTDGLKLIKEEAQRAITEPSYIEIAKEKIQTVSLNHYISSSEVTQLLTNLWLEHVKSALSKQASVAITTLEKLRSFQKAFGIQLTDSEEILMFKLKQAIVYKVVLEGIKNKNKPSKIQTVLSSFQNDLSTTRWKDAIIGAWEAAVESFLSDKLLDEEEESILVEYANYFGLSQKELDRNGAFSRVVKSCVLRDLCQGKVPQRIEVDGALPFNFQKSEQLIWLFKNVEYYEDKKRREYVGGHHGASIRIAKGIYYRIGSFKGYPIEKVERTYVGTGILAITNKHMYFKCAEKAFRIRLDKIVTIEPYSDGVVIQRDAQSALPQAFVTGDGWFTYNLLINLQRII